MSTSTVDNAIDENAYYIGVGDRLHIFLVDMPSMNYPGVISQDFYFVEPTLGVIPIGGKVTLANAKRIIAEYLSRKMKGTAPNKIRILFAGAKTASITAFGSVSNPGTYSFSGTMRLWDVLRSTTSGNMSDINFREVRLKNGDSISYYDLLAFLYKGDFSQNPYIYPGDELYLIPAVDRIFIGGSGLKAWTSGKLPIHKNERAKNFLSFFFLNEAADSEHILIQRTENGRDFQLITYNLKQNQDFLLKNYDAIMIPVKNDYSEVYVANVSGEVIRPGTYPISKGGTAVQTIIAMAGGYSSFADTARTVILRSGKSIPPFNIEGDVRPEIKSGLLMMSVSKDYQILRIKDHPETILKNGDNLFIPRKENMVYISGSVKFPGGYAYQPNKKLDYYIGLAGGYTDLADRRNVAVVASCGNFVYQIKSYDDYVEDGSVISIPVVREYKFFSLVILPAIGMIMSAASIAIGVISLWR